MKSVIVWALGLVARKKPRSQRPDLPGLVKCQPWVPPVVEPTVAQLPRIEKDELYALVVSESGVFPRPQS